jgi:hypothetical protein
MQQYPILNFIVRNGMACAVVLAVLAVVGIAGAGWIVWGWVALPAGIVCGLVIFVLAKSYVEIVALITDMLLPH